MLLHPDRTGGASVRSLARRLGEFRKNEAPNLASMRLKADAQFCVLDRAYRILSNCQKRRAYDSFGMSGVLTLEGLEGSNGAIVLRSKFPDDVSAASWSECDFPCKEKL
jgi:curved DNA-binding protein CbpA